MQEPGVGFCVPKRRSERRFCAGQGWALGAQDRVRAGLLPHRSITPFPPTPLMRQLLLHAYVSRLPADQYAQLRPLYRTGAAAGP